MKIQPIKADHGQLIYSLSRYDWLSASILCAPIVSVTLLSKLAIPPFGAQGIGISIPVILAAMGIGFLTGRLTLSPSRLAFYAALIGFLGFLQIPRSNPISAMSVFLLAALHVPYICAAPRRLENRQNTVMFFLGVATFLAWCGIAQFLLKFVMDVRFLFPIENFVSPRFVVQRFNEQGVIEYGSTLYRSNGVFMLEPSFLSQLLAVAVIVELCTLGRLRSLLVYGLAMIVTFAGTGFLILGVSLPLFVIAKRRWSLVLLVILGAVALVALGDYLHLDRFIARAHEFSSVGSSGFARFVGGFYFFDQFLWTDPLRALFGFGAGTFKLYAIRAHYPVAEMAISKMIFEYGLVGAFAYFTFLFYCMSSSALPKVAVIATAMTLLLNGNYVPFAHGLALSLLVWTSSPGWHERTIRKQRANRASDFSSVSNLPNGPSVSVT